MRALIGLWLAGGCLAAPPVAAGQEGGPPAEAAGGAYLTLVAGTFVPIDDSLEGFENGASLEGTLGYAFADKAALELGVGHYGSSTGAIGPNWLELEIVPVTLSLKVPMHVPGGALFVDMGLGAYFTSMRGVLPLYSGSQVSQAVSGTDRKLGVRFGAGAEIFLGRHLSVVLDARYDIVSSTFFGIGGWLNGLRLGGGLLLRFEGGPPAGTGEETGPPGPLAP